MKPFDSQKTVENLTVFLKTTFKKVGFSKAVIGVSGGVDSAAACVLCIRALGAVNVYPVLMPYGILNTRGTLDAMEFLQSHKIPLKNILRLDIKPAADMLTKNLWMPDNTRRGNIMARMRMIVLFDTAKKLPGLVVGTENRSEHLLGYYTRFGDVASDIEPLRHLYKTQVLELASHLGVGENILKKPPSAGLWDSQTDEGEFGFTYKDADEILYLMFDANKTPEEIVKQGHDKQIVDLVVKRVKDNEFKHDLPYTIR
ncbi:hypothetical protein A2154_04915 [Candidatus Gottesmanbacteria bacterium RBG_16_43_7]|uniref:NH(3)-dependent NAD(+) synthetase n=1 Tax=Candidatus Gottesmanbacteria bacterium RBG_16_43_7 TaxID=1798373 RepID=A0A1F5Z9T2_9BACT|nr:MAG: hypothetical protein A2154_04915 [Candidatus Gottesmanbacteria bacterium RBG_16_43_7]